MQGIHELPTPHRFSLWGCNLQDVPQLVPAEKNRPFDHNTAPFFPFPNPTNIMVDLNLHPDEVPGEFLPQLSFRELVKASVHTKKTSQTTIADSVKNYNAESVLHRVNVSSRLWTALVGFSTGAGPVPMPPDGVNDLFPEGHPEHLNTYRQEAVEALPVPPLEQQLNPIFSLWGWFLMQMSTTTRLLVNTEPAIQDEIYRQLLYPMNQIMESRYGTLNAEIPYEAASPPWWSRHVEEHRVNAVGKAGLPDFMLFHREGAQGQCALAEVKTWWSYPSSRLFTMLSNAHFEGGLVDWDDVTQENNILKQIWSEMYEFGVKFAFWSNGHVMVAILDTTDYTVHPDNIQRQLTFSRIQDMRSENIIYQGIAGLCLASVEYARLQTPQEKLEFMNDLCPPAWREAPGAAQAAFDFHGAE